ncbi:MAG: alcohol dehydrogenase catalytic domain-containing protein, partial [Emcibacteraceae bacterium]|nr:alcohol dehydrogenase catalytic domain-containing protein [Emcibacteraceae bacterium]
MKAVNIKKFGGPEMLEIISCPIPEITVNQVLIKIAASGINRPDIVQRKGFYPAPTDASPILGLECAGVIERVGKNVTSWKAGDEVCALLPGGGYAEYAATDQGSVLKIPNN